jgi:multiple sugar transport system ATP-binding protein
VSRIVLKQIAKSFRSSGHGGSGAVHAVQDVSLAVEQGELLALVGPSGCGKTTTLRLIAGLESLDSGEILIDDKPCGAIPPHRRDVACVFQSGALYPQMTVHENLTFGLHVRKLPREEILQRTTEAIDILELGECRHRLPHELSGGEVQRVVLGRALVRKPAIFLMDEPLAHLDEPSRLQLRTWIIRVHKETGAAMLYVTHDQREAMALGDRVAVMREGRLEQAGTPAEIYRSPANRFVATFIGSRPMNLVPGQMGSRDEHLWFEPEGSDEIVLTVPAELSRPIKGDSIKVTLGLRPEHFSLNKPAGADESWRLPGRLLAIEYSGADAYARLAFWGREWIVRVPGDHALKPGAAVAIWADLRRASLFDALD